MSEGGAILVRRASEAAWTQPEVGSYDNEHHLQEVLAADPSLIPGVAVDSMTVMELSTSAGPIDVCVVGLDGSITVVECKLASNSERRRMVIGQVLDYASAIWSEGAEMFLDSWAVRAKQDLRDILEPGALDHLRANISSARIDLCLAVDLIDDDLRRLVEYLNHASSPEVAVTAIQLTYARHGDVEMLIPTTFGGEIAAAKDPTHRRAGVRWTRDLLLESCVDDGDKVRVRRLFELQDATRGPETDAEQLWFGSYPGGGVFFHPHGVEKAPFQLWVNVKGLAMVYGNWMQYSTIQGHDGFAPVAAVLDQDHRDGQKGVPLANVDVDALWRAALEAAVLINE